MDNEIYRLYDELMGYKNLFILATVHITAINAIKSNLL